MIVNTGSFHYPVGDMAGIYLTVNGDWEFCDWAKPNFMIPLSVSMKVAAMFG
jgi:Na+/H+ antiporter NhaD/arsenite permease-like protein